MVKGLSRGFRVLQRGLLKEGACVKGESLRKKNKG
jgi:hypothetical protein